MSSSFAICEGWTPSAAGVFRRACTWGELVVEHGVGEDAGGVGGTGITVAVEHWAHGAQLLRERTAEIVRFVVLM